MLTFVGVEMESFFVLLKAAEYKKRLEEDATAASESEEVKKKMAWDMKQLELKVATLVDENDKLNKSKKKLVSEVIVMKFSVFFTG